MTRALFVNSGMLGHRAFAGLMTDITGRVPGLDACHINLSENLTTTIVCCAGFSVCQWRRAPGRLPTWICAAGGRR